VAQCREILSMGCTEAVLFNLFFPVYDYHRQNIYVYLFICLSVYLSIYLSVNLLIISLLSIYLYLSINQSVPVSSVLVYFP
jgi:ABC-type Co2+ transport system permease subunit